MRTTCALSRTSATSFERDAAQADGPVLLVIPEGSCGTCQVAIGAMRAAPSIPCYCLDESGAREVAATYGVSYRPTLLLLRAGKVVRRLIGAPLPDVIETILRTEATLGGHRS